MKNMTEILETAKQHPEYFKSSIMLELGEMLSKEMNEKNLTVDDIAKNSRISKRKVKNILNGSTDNLSDIVKAFMSVGKEVIV
jgi:predicted transcriptional regulator